MFQRSFWSLEASRRKNKEGKSFKQESELEVKLRCYFFRDLYLCLIFLSQSWSVSVGGVGHSHIDIVWLYLE